MHGRSRTTTELATMVGCVGGHGVWSFDKVMWRGIIATVSAVRVDLLVGSLVEAEGVRRAYLHRGRCWFYLYCSLL